MQWLRTVHPLYYATAVFVALGLALHQVVCLYLAAGCLVLGFLQQRYDDRTGGGR